MKTIVMIGVCLIVAALLGLAAAPACAQQSVSDVFTVTDPAGAVLLSIPALEGPGEPEIVYTGVPGVAGIAPLVWLEDATSQVISDVFGLVINQNDAHFGQLAFMSDFNELGVDPAFATSIFGTLGPPTVEPVGPWDVTAYIPSTVFPAGSKATFQSDAEVPEPSTCVLLGVAAIGFIGYTWRRWTVTA